MTKAYFGPQAMVPSVVGTGSSLAAIQALLHAEYFKAVSAVRCARKKEKKRKNHDIDNEDNHKYTLIIIILN